MMNESITQDLNCSSEDKAIAKVFDGFCAEFFAKNTPQDHIPLWYQQEKPWRP